MHQFKHKSLTFCIHCKSKRLSRRKDTTLGYENYRCKDCKRTFNQRSPTVFNNLDYPTDIVLLAVRRYLAYKLSYRDVAEIFLDSGLVVTYEAIREWVSKFAPLLTEKFKQKRKYKAGPSHYIDETYIRIKGKWVYVYRGIDRNGNLVNTMVSETRDMDAAKKFFSESEEVCGIPERVTTDGHSAYPRAIAEVNGTDVKHRVNGYLHNFTEQSHRPLKQRYYPMLGFKSFKGASIFCPAHDELRNFFKPSSIKSFTPKQKRCIRASKIYSLNKIVENL